MPRATRRALGIALLALALAVAPAAAQESSMRGTWTLNRQLSDRVPEPPRRATTAQRATYGALTDPAGRLAIAFPDASVATRYDLAPPMLSPADGRVVAYTAADGQVFDLSTEWENGRLEQTLHGDGLTRAAVFTVSADGDTLTMDVHVTGGRGLRAARYRLVYDRAD